MGLYTCIARPAAAEAVRRAFIEGMCEEATSDLLCWLLEGALGHGESTCMPVLASASSSCCALQARLLANAQDAILGGSVGEGLSGASLAGGALQLLPLALTRASLLFPRILHVDVDQPGGQYIFASLAGMGSGLPSAAAMQHLLPNGILTPASPLHPLTRHVYHAGRLVRPTRWVSALVRF